MSSCILCDIVNGEAEGSFVHRDDRVSAFLDIRPVNPGHVLVVTNEHVPLIGDVPEQIRGRLLHIAVEVGDALRATGRGDGFDLFLADGEAAGQEVPHAHLHVIPRSPGDGFTIDAEAWRGPQPKRADLDRQAEEISSAM